MRGGMGWSDAVFVLECFHMKKAIIALAIVFIINIPGLYYDWYGAAWWFDVILHFSGGFFVAMFFLHYLKDYLSQGTGFKNLIIITGSTLLVGVLWEFAEFTASLTLIDFFYDQFQIRTYFIGDLQDTMSDLSLDIAGALVLFSIHSLRRRNTHEG
jgi:hypothetical protein